MGIVRDDHAVAQWFEDRMCPSMIGFIAWYLDDDPDRGYFPLTDGRVCAHERCVTVTALFFAQLMAVCGGSDEMAWDLAYAAALKVRIATNPVLPGYRGPDRLSLRSYARNVLGEVARTMDHGLGLERRRGRPRKVVH